MAWYRNGTVTVTSGSTTVIGVGTTWVQSAAPGETFLGPDGAVYEIAVINSNVSLSISTAYRGSTSAAQNYAIMPTQGYLRDLAAQAAALVASYAGVRDGAGAGKFPAGTAAAPSLRGVADENTGVNLPGGDILQLITAGAVRLQIAADGTPTGVMVEKLPVSAATQTAIDNLAGLCVSVASVGSGSNQVPTGQHLGALATQDAVGALQVLRHTPDSRPGEVWRQWVSNTQTILKRHCEDGVIRSMTTETWA